MVGADAVCVTAQLPPELARLQLEYDNVLDRFEANHLTLEQARATLAALSVIDADGAVWGVDDEGRFVRRVNPDAPPEIANPALFAAARTPQAPGAPSGSWEAARPAPDPTPMPSPQPAAVPQPSGVSHQAPSPTPAGSNPFEQPPVRPATPGADIPADSGAQPRHHRPHSVWKERRDSLAGWATQNRTTIGVVAAVAAILLGAVWVRSNSAPGSTAASSTTEAPSTTSGGDTRSPETTAEPPGPTAAPTSSAPGTGGVQPSATDVDLVLANLTSAQRDVATKAVIDDGTGAAVATNVAFYAGLAHTQMGIRTGEVSVGDAGVTQRWVLFDQSSGTDLAEARVQWRSENSVWKLAAWPAWTELSS